MKRWWRSHSVRVRLTLWYVITMILVLGLYAAVIFLFVSRSASESLEGQLRRDFQLAAATIYRAQTTDSGTCRRSEASAAVGTPWPSESPAN